MKLICVNIDECGFYCRIKDLENPDHGNICPECFGLAITYSDNKSPLIYDVEKKEGEIAVTAILAIIHNKINSLIKMKKNEEDDTD